MHTYMIDTGTLIKYQKLIPSIFTLCGGIHITVTTNQQFKKAKCCHGQRFPIMEEEMEDVAIAVQKCRQLAQCSWITLLTAKRKRLPLITDSTLLCQACENEGVTAVNSIGLLRQLCAGGAMTAETALDMAHQLNIENDCEEILYAKSAV